MYTWRVARGRSCVWKSHPQVCVCSQHPDNRQSICFRFPPSSGESIKMMLKEEQCLGAELQSVIYSSRQALCIKNKLWLALRVQNMFLNLSLPLSVCVFQVWRGALLHVFFKAAALDLKNPILREKRFGHTSWGAEGCSLWRCRKTLQGPKWSGVEDSKRGVKRCGHV